MAEASLPPACLHRPMRHTDIPRVAAIEETSQFTPWSSAQFGECLDSGYQCDVVLAGEEIIAFQVLSAVLDESHLLNLGVAPSWRRQGLARAMLTMALQRARQQGATSLYLEVRRSNTAAMRLYRALGFEETGFRRDYYRARQGREDAVLMQKRL